MNGSPCGRTLFDVVVRKFFGRELGRVDSNHERRAAVKVGLLRAGVPEVIADYYIGHSSGPTQRAYVPEHAPETSPYWDALIVAVNTIPAHP